MKALMILGAMVGFVMGTGLGLVAENPWPTILWKACAAALVSAVLARWWSRVWLRGLEEAIADKQAAASQASNSKAPSKV